VNMIIQNGRASTGQERRGLADGLRRAGII